MKNGPLASEEDPTSEGNISLGPTEKDPSILSLPLLSHSFLTQPLISLLFEVHSLSVLAGGGGLVNSSLG